MNVTGLSIGMVVFGIIGVFHPIVIKAEYYFGKKIWPLFLAAGIGSIWVSAHCKETIDSAAMGVLGFTCLWSIKELYEQEERVRKGWFPRRHNNG